MKDFNKKRRDFLIFSSAATIMFFTGCERKIDLSARKIHFDRDICDRCKMVISIKNYAAQIIDPKDGKHYNFDDLGCAVNWFKEKDIAWENEAVVYVADVQTSEMIDARKAFYTDKANSPMNFGFAAHKLEQSGVENFNYEHVKIRMVEIAREKKKSMSHHKS